MKKYIFFLLFVLVWTGGPTAQAQSVFKASEDPYEEREPAKSKLNNKRLEKNLDKYAEELQLTSRQIKKIEKLERKYSRRERRLQRRSSTRKRDLRALQERKREDMIEVLTVAQRKKLESLSKRGVLDFFRL